MGGRSNLRESALGEHTAEEKSQSVYYQRWHLRPVSAC